MPVQYQTIPQFQMPEMNLLGAYAQGQALQQNRLQQERLAQQMGIAEQAASIAAAKDARAAEAEDARRIGLELDNAAKYKTQFESEVSKINPRAPDFQAKYDALVARYAPLAPTLMAGVPKTHTPETWQAFISSHDDLMKQLAPAETETVVDGVRGKALFRTDPFTQQRTMVAGSFVPTAKNYSLTKEGLAFDQATGTFKVPTLEAPAPARGQAGAFTGEDLTTDLIKQREGYIEKPKYDVNAYRAGYGSDTVTRADGSVERVKPGMSVSREDAERDLQRRIQTEFVPKAAAKVGEENWTQLPENTRAALTSVAYNYGTIPSRIVPAVQSGNPETIARAIESLAGDNKGVNAGRRMQEANIARGTTFPGTRAVPAFAAMGSPEFMGGPQIQPPINMMAPAPAPANAFVAPPASPVDVSAGLAQPRPQAAPMTYAEAAKQPLKQKNTQVFGELLNAAQAMEDANILPKLKGEKPLQRAAKIGEALLPSSVQRTIDPEAERLRTGFTNVIDQYINSLRSTGELTAGEANTVKELEAKKAMLGSADMTIDEIRDIVRSLDKNLGSGELSKSVPIIVSVPGHGPVSFPNQAAADAFKREAGL